MPGSFVNNPVVRFHQHTFNGGKKYEKKTDVSAFDWRCERFGTLEEKE